MFGRVKQSLGGIEPGRVVCDVWSAHGFYVWASDDHVVFDIRSRVTRANGFVIPRSDVRRVMSKMHMYAEGIDSSDAAEPRDLSCSAGDVTVDPRDAHPSYFRCHQNGLVDTVSVGGTTVDVSNSRVAIKFPEVETILRSLDDRETTVHHAEGRSTSQRAEWYDDLSV